MIFNRYQAVLSAGMCFKIKNPGIMNYETGIISLIINNFNNHPSELQN